MTSQEEERGDSLSEIPKSKKVTSDDKVFFENGKFKVIKETALLKNET